MGLTFQLFLCIILTLCQHGTHYYRSHLTVFLALLFLIYLFYTMHFMHTMAQTVPLAIQCFSVLNGLSQALPEVFLPSRNSTQPQVTILQIT